MKHIRKIVRFQKNLVRFWFQVCWIKVPSFIKIGPFFWPFFGPKTQTRWAPNPKFWYYFPPIDLWKWAEFEKNPWWHSWGWFYSVSWNVGCGATPIWAGPDPKYFSHLTNFQKSLTGPSFGKIPEIKVPPVLMTWKMCLLNDFFWVKQSPKKFAAFSINVDQYLATSNVNTGTSSNTYK